MKPIPEKLYREIIAWMPVPCVDLMVRNRKSEFLLVERNNMPARDHWWFPGGRILYGERRQAAVRRKLAQECNLTPATIRELGTHSLMLDREDDEETAHHSITTVYLVQVDASQRLQLDAQSRNACWKKIEAWLEEPLHPFIQRCLVRYGHAENE